VSTCTLDDAMALRADLLSCSRLVVVGDGVLGAAVTGLAGTCGRIIGVCLDSGDVLPADVVVVAFGAAPPTEWLAGSGLRVDNGLVCDSRCRAGAGIYAAGDVARWHHEQLDALLRLENRTNATEQAVVAADTILPEHARLRRMVTAPFAIKRVEAMRPSVQKIVNDLIDDMLAGPKPVDLVEAFALPAPSLVICQLLGVPYTDHDFFQDNSKVLINRDAAPEERRAAGGRLFEYLDKLVGEKLDNPGDDLLSGLTGRVKNGELSRPDAT
jgi:hypothetical protein